MLLMIYYRIKWGYHKHQQILLEWRFTMFKPENTSFYFWVIFLNFQELLKLKKTNFRRKTTKVERNGHLTFPVMIIWMRSFFCVLSSTGINPGLFIMLLYRKKFKFKTGWPQSCFEVALSASFWGISDKIS